MQNGHKGKEMWFHNCLEGKELDIFLGKSVNKSYHQHARKYYDKLTKLYRRECMQYWKFRMKRVYLRYNYNRQWLIFETQYERWSRNALNEEWKCKA